MTVDGIDLRGLEIEQLRSRIAILFQQPVQFNDTVRKNIAYGDLCTPPEAFNPAAQAASVEVIIERPPQGYDSMLGRWFAEGAELSVDEWQRLPWLEPSPEARPFWFWMSPPAPWTPRPKPIGWRVSASWPPAARF